MTEGEFDALLRFLVSAGPEGAYDRDNAGIKYEQFRRVLVKMFINRGSYRPEELADETFDRVARKVMKMKEAYVGGEPAKYIVTVAKYIWLEERKRESQSAESDEPPDEFRSQCLLECMMKVLSKSERSKITEYYRYDGKLKSEHRDRIAKLYKMTKGALANGVFKIKERLAPCVKRCCEKKNNDRIH